MDPDSEKYQKIRKPRNSMPNGGNVLQPTWVRCSFRPCDEAHRFLLSYGLYFLLPISVILWALFLITK